MLVASTLKSLVTIGPVKLETKTFDLPYVTMWSKGHAALWLVSPDRKLPPFHVSLL